MRLDHDNAFEAPRQLDVAPAAKAPAPVSPVLTAELALIDMLARVIVDAIQRHAITPEVTDP